MGTKNILLSNKIALLLVITLGLLLISNFSIKCAGEGTGPGCTECVSLPDGSGTDKEGALVPVAQAVDVATPEEIEQALQRNPRLKRLLEGYARVKAKYMQRVGSNERLRKLERTQDEALRIATLRQQQRLLEQLSSAGAKDKSTGGIINGAMGTAKDIFNATIKPAFVWTLGAVIFLEVFGAVMGNIRVPVLGRVFAGFNEIRPIKRFFDYLFGSKTISGQSVVGKSVGWWLPWTPRTATG
jgi:hypothetical protein